MDRSGIDRRALLRGAGAALLLAPTLAVAGGRFAAAAGPRQIDLVAGPARARLGPAELPPAEVWAYGGRVPGPTLRLRQGEPVEIAFRNTLPQATTLHCHGLRLPHAMDGVPHLTQPPVAPGGQFRYAFAPPDAGTYWYHPHVKASEQQGRGLYGALIVEEPEPPAADREVIWAIDDWRLTETGAISETFGHPMDHTHAGRLGNTVTVNGDYSDAFPVRAGERIRLRLLNCANARIFALRFEDQEVTVIARDGHPVPPAPAPAEGIVLAPGQRADLMLDVASDPGTETRVVDAYDPRRRYHVMRLLTSGEAPRRTSPLDAPVRLPENPMPALDLGTAERHRMVLEGGAMGRLETAIFRGERLGLRELFQRHGKAWTQNGVAADRPDMPPAFRFRLGRTQIVEIENRTGWPHPMHLHGHAFQVLGRDGQRRPEAGWTDTVLLAPDARTTIALVADNPGDWLFHCHIQEHHEAGMSSVVTVA